MRQFPSKLLHLEIFSSGHDHPEWGVLRLSDGPGRHKLEWDSGPLAELHFRWQPLWRMLFFKRFDGPDEQ